MATFETQAHIGPDGRLTLLMPAGFADSDVRVVVEKHGGNGQAPGRIATASQRAEALRQLAGSIDDPTFTRPPQGDFPSREPLD